ncbi:MAG TPA: hypothetical protein VFW07_00360 [Parafilimonas sp.]|nr:hypothetical protein [Parafilimonas sp.]
MDFKQQYESLYQQLKNELPFKAFPVRELVHVFRDKNISITLKTELIVTDVYNSGDISGIMCVVASDKKNPIVCSLMHLIFSPGFHLYKDITEYQRKREKRIRKLNGL